MANAFFNNQTRNLTPVSRGKSSAQPGGGKTAPFKEKAGFPGGLPGKAQPDDRSCGVKKVLPHPKSDGI